MNIIISGWYGNNNAGDEALFSALIGGLRSKGYKNLSALSYNPQYSSQKSDIHIFSEVRLNPIDAFNAIRKADVFILGGGGLLKDEGRSYILCLLKVAYVKLFRKKVLACGIGVGPFYTKLGKLITKAIVMNIDIMTVRDQESFMLLKNLGIKDNVMVLPDLAFTLPRPDPSMGKKLLDKYGINPSASQKLIGISLRPWYHVKRLWPDGDQLFNAFLFQFSESLRSIIKIYDAIPVFLPLQSRTDIWVWKQLIEKYNFQSVVPPSWNEDLDFLEIMSLVSNMDLVIGMRLHSLIFASLSNTPMIAISYSEKVSSLMRLMELSNLDLSVDDFKSDCLIDRVNYVFKNEQLIKSCISIHVESLRIKSNENFNIVDKYISST